jgi:hypothetical protein
VRALMVYFVGSEMNQIGMAGVPELVQALRGNTYVHPRRGLVHEYYFFVTAVPGTLLYYHFQDKSNETLRKVTFWR